MTAAFETAWGLEGGAPLLTSFDGCAVFRPPQLAASWATQGALGWLHVVRSPVARSSEQQTGTLSSAA